MSDTPKKRPWFQYHLSTAVVMMFVAAGVLWANLAPHARGRYDGYLFDSHPGGCRDLWIHYVWGWPLQAASSKEVDSDYTYFDSDLKYLADMKSSPDRYISIWERIHAPEADELKHNFFGAKFNVLSTCIDGGICLSIIGCVAGLLEWRIRRRARDEHRS